ncbi:MAG: aldo/keto reductase, partial [Desulfobacterales bacterium]|nr:aldo/keto reductase [Desulfobacterales bacterium]
QFGLGVYITKPSECVYACLSSFEAGYRHIDTASIYGNEKEVGEAVKRSGTPREEIFVTTKLWNDDHSYDKALKAFDKSLKNLGLDYIDLYLIHWPGTDKRKEAWKALENIYESGRCRAIGVSNYMIHHLEELLGYANIIPAVNQVEFHAFLYLKDLLEFCAKHKIALEGYSPLARMKRLNNHVVEQMMKKYSKSYSQIMIKWSLQNDVITIPKSAKRERIFENANVFDFEISDKDMGVLNGLDEGLRLSWDPTTID